MQSNTGRALVALAAIALVAAAFFVLGGDDEAGQGSADPTTPTTAETTPADETEGQEPNEPVREPKPDLPEIKLVDGAPIDGVLELEFDKGDQVEFAFTSDIDTELHVHGYDLYPQVKGGETETVSFPAEFDGVYEIENHANALQVAELTINP